MTESAVKNPCKRHTPLSLTPRHTRSRSQSSPLDAHIPRPHQTQYPRFHEIAHALGISYKQYGRRRAEVLVDTVTFIVCGAVGLDTSGSSVPYVAGWGESGELDAIRGYAETIDKIARRIEDSLRSDASPAAAHQTPLAA